MVAALFTLWTRSLNLVYLSPLLPMVRMDGWVGLFFHSRVVCSTKVERGTWDGGTVGGASGWGFGFSLVVFVGCWLLAI